MCQMLAGRSREINAPITFFFKVMITLTLRLTERQYLLVNVF